MNKLKTIKGIDFNSGKPIVCIPVVKQTKDEILSEISRLSQCDVRMIEWRMDWFDELTDLDAVSDILSQMKSYLTKTVLLATYRSAKEGGQGLLKEDAWQKLAEVLCRHDAVDMIDFEIEQHINSLQQIENIKNSGRLVVASNHNFNLTPTNQQMYEELMKMHAAGADLCKLAVMPQSFDDVLRLLSVTRKIKDSAESFPMITMAMGKEGMLSRLCGELTGSVVTFASLGETSAPGQVEKEPVEEILNQIHKCIEAGASDETSR